MFKDKSDRVNAARWLAGMLGRAGIVVLAAVVPFAAWALWRLSGVRGGMENLANPLWWLSAGVLLVFVLLVVDRLVRAAGDLDRPVQAEYFGFPAVLAVLAVLFAVVAIPAQSFPLLSSPRDFTPSEEAIGLWMATVLVALGTVLYLGTLVRPSKRRRGRWWVGAPAGVLVVMLAAVLVKPLSEYRPISHSFLAEAPGEPAPVPADVTRVGWTWEPPEGADVVRVDAGTHGPVVVLRDGLVGLDGQSGEELWSHRARYSHSGFDWADGVLGNRDDLASVVFRRSGGDKTTRLILDTATGQVVEDLPFPEDVPRRIADWAAGRTPHAVPGAYVYGADSTVYAFDAGGGELWERPYGEGNPEQLCTSEREHGVLPYGDQIIVSEMCADADPLGERSPSAQDWRGRVGEAQHSGTVSLVALDVLTGEENWRREWEPHGEEQPPVLFSPGGPRPGADPVFLIGDRAFDVHTGEDLDVVPAGLVEVNESGHVQDGVYLHADSEGVLVVEGPDPGSGDPHLLHRTDSDGNVLDTTALPDSKESAPALRGVVLADVLAHTDITSPYSLNAGEKGDSAVVLTPLGEGALTEEDMRRVDFSSDLLLPPEDGRGGDDSAPVEFSRHLVPVPGALVLVLSVGDASGENTQLHGLVP